MSTALTILDAQVPVPQNAHSFATVRIRPDCLVLFVVERQRGPWRRTRKRQKIVQFLLHQIECVVQPESPGTPLKVATPA